MLRLLDTLTANEINNQEKRLILKCIKITLLISLCFWTMTAQAALDPNNCWSVVTTLTDIVSRSELKLTDTPTPGSIAKSIYNGIEHYSYVIGVYDNGQVMVLECGKGLGNNPKPGKGGCGFRILGSSPNETIKGYHVP